MDDKVVRTEMGNGNYALTYFYDDSENLVDSEHATHGFIQQFDSNDHMVMETSFQTCENNGYPTYNSEDYNEKHFEPSELKK